MNNSANASQARKELWTQEEDAQLIEYVTKNGTGRWSRISEHTGLKRCGKSCRLRWVNHLNPDVKRGEFSEEEEDLICRLHKLLGNRWSLIAGRVPGRTDNQVKNHWNTHMSKKLGIKKNLQKEGRHRSHKKMKMEMEESEHVLDAVPNGEQQGR